MGIELDITPAMIKAGVEAFMNGKTPTIRRSRMRCG